MIPGVPTPLYSHAGRGDFRDVYEPAEDSFLLMDALEQDAARLSPCVCLEVGSGSGVVSAFYPRCWDPQLCTCECTDVNPAAARCTAETASRNRVPLQPVLTDLAQCLLPRLCGKVDVLLFNPPYVVTPSEEVSCSDLPLWAAGRRVTDRLLPLVGRLLSAAGLFYLVTIAENRPGGILGQQGLTGEPCLTTRAGNERLSILRFHRSPENTT
uniref:Methyltransferase HEMK2 n=1 Tax=Salarias fasciatus TaxID=181472 RepID=A0A672FU09_SALFA